MAVTFTGPASWFVAADPTITISWAAGDEVLIFGATESDATTLTTPTATGLTFSLVTSTSVVGGEAFAALWRATAASAGTGVVVTSVRGGSNGTQMCGLAAWVHSGSVSSVTAVAGSFTESAPSLTVAAGDEVIVAISDFSGMNPPGKTPLTGSGTATERFDVGNTSNYAVWGADWVGTSAGTFSFGPNDYTGLQVAQVGAVITPTPPTTPSLTQSHYRWGLDDGTEAAHTFAAAEDAGISAAAAQRRLLRVQVDETAGAASTAGFTLQYRRVGDPDWRTIE